MTQANLPAARSKRLDCFAGLSPAEKWARVLRFIGSLIDSLALVQAFILGLVAIGVAFSVPLLILIPSLSVPAFFLKELAKALPDKGAGKVYSMIHRALVSRPMAAIGTVAGGFSGLVPDTPLSLSVSFFVFGAFVGVFRSVVDNIFSPKDMHNALRHVARRSDAKVRFPDSPKTQRVLEGLAGTAAAFSFVDVMGYAAWCVQLIFLCANFLPSVLSLLAVPFVTNMIFLMFKRRNDPKKADAAFHAEKYVAHAVGEGFAQMSIAALAGLSIYIEETGNYNVSAGGNALAVILSAIFVLLPRIARGVLLHEQWRAKTGQRPMTPFFQEPARSARASSLGQQLLEDPSGSGDHSPDAPSSDSDGDRVAAMV